MQLTQNQIEALKNLKSKQKSTYKICSKCGNHIDYKSNFIDITKSFLEKREPLNRIRKRLIASFHEECFQ